MPQFNTENLLKVSLPAFILIGVTQLASYYYQFKIPIFDYLDFTEIIVFFLGNISMYISIMYFMSFILLKNTPKYVIVPSISYVLLEIIVVINGNIEYRIISTDTLIIAVFGILIFFLLAINKNKIKIPVFTGNENWIMVYATLVICLLIISLSGYFNAIQTKSRHPYKGTSIFIDGKEIKSNDTCYFVGKTHNYVFFFNEKDSTSLIYPISKIDKIIFKAKDSHFSFW